MSKVIIEVEEQADALSQALDLHTQIGIEFMRKLISLFLMMMAVTATQAAVPIGRFTQEMPYGTYRDIRIADDGKTAVWITKDCHDCKEVQSAPMSVVDIGNGFVRIGKTEFEVDDGGAGLFHPSLGSWIVLTNKPVTY